jgi:hypothetical protein
VNLLLAGDPPLRLVGARRTADALLRGAAHAHLLPRFAKLVEISRNAPKINSRSVTVSIFDLEGCIAAGDERGQPMRAHGPLVAPVTWFGVARSTSKRIGRFVGGLTFCFSLRLPSFGLSGIS